MKKTLSILVPICFATLNLTFAQISFRNQNALLTPVAHYSGVAVAVMDMNGDGRDDIVRMDQGHDLAIEYQNAPNQAFTHLSIGDVSFESQWGICAADIDNNGFADILTGGDYDGVEIVRASATGDFYTIEELSEPGTFTQGVNFADINNDGWLDAFVRHDDGPGRIFINDGAGHLILTSNVINLKTVPASDNSGNYGSVWCDVDNDGDTDFYIAKCRQGVTDSTDGRRINMLFINNGDGSYTQDITNERGLRIGAQSWTADFGDIDNDGDFDCFITNHDVTSQLLENDGTGHFTDITNTSGLNNAVSEVPIQGVFRDFDNDGYEDILVAGKGQFLFRNNGNKTFSKIANPFNNNIMESFAVGDLNHDGFLDIYASYATVYTEPSGTPDVLWMNNGNANHYFGMTLIGNQSNRNAVGARVTLYSALGAQVREVRSGESYGISNSLHVNFGLGQLTQIDSVEIHWPSGTVDVLFEPLADQYITVHEGGCISMPVTLAAPNGTTICSGQQAQLTTTEEFAEYLWSNGDTTSVINATQAGLYTVTVTNLIGCTSVSNPINIVVDPVQIPTVTIEGDSIFCAGGAVVLTCSEAGAYLWNTGDTTRSIIVNTSGNYFVSAQGLCAQFNSSAHTIEVLSADAPLVSGDSVLENSTATLIASGNNIKWFESENAPDEFFFGDTLVTGPLSANDTFWVSGTSIYGGPRVFTGMAEHMGTTQGSSAFNGQIIFDAYQPFNLYRATVRTTKAGARKIDLIGNDGTVLQSATFTIPSGITTLDLNFKVPLGQGLKLTTDPVVNTASLGSLGPQLYRSDQGLAYPYVVPGILSINGANTALITDRYYYFYNWEIGKDSVFCESERVPVIAVVTPVVAGSEPQDRSDLRLFPNPTSGKLTVALDHFEGGTMSVRVKNMHGMLLNASQTEFPAGLAQWQSDLSDLPKGVYLLEIQSGKRILNRKVAVR